MLERVRRLPNLMVPNDEARHVHDDDLAWNQTLLALHDNLKRKARRRTRRWGERAHRRAAGSRTPRCYHCGLR